MPPYKLLYFKSLTSTQDKAREFAKKELSNIIIISDVQTKGRGRFKRKWHSGKGGLWMSILLKASYGEKIQYLTFIAAIAVAKSIKNIANLDAKIKWPNDIHYEKKKLCGILTEGTFGKDNYVAVGIGANVNQDKFPKDIRNIATSLRIISNKKISTGKLKNGIIKEFFALYNKFYKKNKMKQILKIWQKNCDTINKNVTVSSMSKKIKGKAMGVDENCSLLLKTKNNQVIKIIEGDIKVRY